MSFVRPQTFASVSPNPPKSPRPCSRGASPVLYCKRVIFRQHPPHFSPPLVCRSLCLTISASPNGTVLSPIASIHQYYNAIARTHRFGLPFSRKFNFASPPRSWGAAHVKSTLPQSGQTPSNLLTFSKFASSPHRMRNRGLPTGDSSKDEALFKRRRASIFDLLVSQPGTTELSQTASFRQNYGALKTTEERIEKAVQLFLKDVLDPFLEDPEAENIFQEFDSFVSAQVAKRLTPAEADKLEGALVNALAVDIKEVDHFKVMKTFGKAILSYFDIITDVLVLVDLATKGNTRMAIAQGVSLGFSFLCQYILSLVFGQPLWVVPLTRSISVPPYPPGGRPTTRPTRKSWTFTKSTGPTGAETRPTGLMKNSRR